ncbi:transposase [Azotobacter chroococcum]|uniref:transposase n=1 Tax=Azotobacter chroococcum TaxID=353 RepID=UPI003BF9CB76
MELHSDGATVNEQLGRQQVGFMDRFLLIGAEQPVFVIVDGHPVHKARLVRAFVEEQAGRLKLFYLPPYSPQLNPDEQVWGHVKRSVSRRLVQNREEMKKLALGALRRIQKLPELVKSFFRHPDCRYTAA